MEEKKKMRHVIQLQSFVACLLVLVMVATSLTTPAFAAMLGEGSDDVCGLIPVAPPNTKSKPNQAFFCV